MEGMSSRFSHALPLLVFLLAAQTLPAILPLRDQWQAACRALSGGDAASALHLFREFNDWYADEPEVQDPAFHEGRIRLWGLAALEAGEFGEAATLLERWLGENPDLKRYRAFLRFQLIGLYQSIGELEALDRHREIFLVEHPELPECALVRWSWADALISSGDFPQAREHLQAVLESVHLPTSGLELARAALALVELASGNRMEALQMLHTDEQGSSGRMLRFWKALLAPALVKQFLEEDDPDTANQVAAWFDRVDSMKSHLSEVRSPLAANIRNPGGTGIRQSIWNRHWSAQLDRLDHSLGVQADSNGGTDVLYTLRLRALLAAKEARKATVLAEALLRSHQPLEPNLRAEAFKADIEASLQLKAWERAQARVEAFAREYPDDPALPEIQFLSARTAAARTDWPAALNQVDILLQSHPGHPSRRTWALLRGDWLLQSGRPEEALEAFHHLEASVPDAWKPFLAFQSGRCLAALREPARAVAQFRIVADMPGANYSLRESAYLEQLKLFLRYPDETAFQKTLATYRKTFPDGQQRWMIENLAGTFQKALGQPEQAIDLFAPVAASGHPAAAFAREELSGLYRQVKDLDGLRRHGLDWIRSGLLEDLPVPPQPFVDCLDWQLTAARTALPPALLQDLLEDLQAGRQAFAVTPFLDLLENQWPAYREAMGASAETMPDWCKKMADHAYNVAAWAAFAAYQLHEAELLHRQGRIDSADARRIRVLQAVDPYLLPEEAAFTVAETASRYDFPEGGDLFSLFLHRFPHSAQRPAGLFHLALILRQTEGEGKDEAIRLLEEIIQDWADSALYREAALRLARWRIDDFSPDQALALLNSLLDDPFLSPSETSRALLWRSHADFMTGKPERGILNCLRIIQIYPDIAETALPACELLLEKHSRMPEGEQKEQLKQKILETAPQHVLEHFNLAQS